MSGRTCPKCGGKNLRERKNGAGYISWRCRDCERGKQETGGRVPSKPKTPQEAVQEHRLRERLAQLESQNRGLIADLSNARLTDELLAAARRHTVKPIEPREKRAGKMREATALACASDWHVEEQVRPEQVAGRNRYDLAISERRMARFFEAVRFSIEFNRQIFVVRDLVLWLGGDFITNFLHPDNVETNLLSPPKALAYAQAHIAAGIRHLLADDKIERIVVPCNDGNHGRMTDKMRSANRTAMSLETMLYAMLAREFEQERRVEFLIASGEHLYHEIYGRSVRFTHGDSVRYAGGVGGVTIPIYKALGRWDTVRRADLTVMGHFHQLTSLADLIINGSLIGYSPYSMTIGARFEPPAQAFTILDPVRFKSVSMPLWVAERADDNENPPERVRREG